MLDQLPHGSNVPADAVDFMNWALNQSPSSLPFTEAELESHYRERLADDERCEAAARPAPVRFFTAVSMKGKKFVASVETSEGEKFKAGTFKTEPEAWMAAKKLSRELQEGRAA